MVAGWERLCIIYFQIQHTISLPPLENNKDKVIQVSFIFSNECDTESIVLCIFFVLVIMKILCGILTTLSSQCSRIDAIKSLLCQAVSSFFASTKLCSRFSHQHKTCLGNFSRHPSTAFHTLNLGN